MVMVFILHVIIAVEPIGADSIELSSTIRVHTVQRCDPLTHNNLIEPSMTLKIFQPYILPLIMIFFKFSCIPLSISILNNKLTRKLYYDCTDILNIKII